MEPIYLSLVEAQNLITIIKPEIIKLIRLKKTIKLLETVEIEFDDNHKTLVNNTRLNRKYHKLSYDFYTTLDKLHFKGVTLKDIDQGIVVFYSFFEGREIFLCWNISDKKIRYWYEARLDYNSRKPVSMIEQKLRNQ
ncbi:MAG: DUF2203 domain-containing protein [Nanoarchaeota archaeon]|nr:DUF2203 domain-containing protein [Nanoarchaeota archaeon]MBU1854995.1 DUF2203 domain-containing protein [Nanoarchaeota archaeon]